MKAEIKELYIKTLGEKYPGRSVFNVQELVKHADSLGMSYPTFITKPSNRAARGSYRVDMITNVVPLPKRTLVDQEPQETNKVTQTVFDQMQIEIPKKDPMYVPWGFYRDVKQVVESNAFYPIFIAGLSGNGKTMMVEQSCAAAKRKYVRVNITEESDEDDLIGGFRLVNGETVWCDGPIPQAMKQGAICLKRGELMDLGNNLGTVISELYLLFSLQATGHGHISHLVDLI